MSYGSKPPSGYSSGSSASNSLVGSEENINWQDSNEWEEEVKTGFFPKIKGLFHRTKDFISDIKHDHDPITLSELCDFIQKDSMDPESSTYGYSKALVSTKPLPRSSLAFSRAAKGMTYITLTMMLGTVIGVVSTILMTGGFGVLAIMPIVMLAVLLSIPLFFGAMYILFNYKEKKWFNETRQEISTLNDEEWRQYLGEAQNKILDERRDHIAGIARNKAMSANQSLGQQLKSYLPAVGSNNNQRGGVVAGVKHLFQGHPHSSDTKWTELGHESKLSIASARARNPRGYIPAPLNIEASERSMYSSEDELLEDEEILRPKKTRKR